MKPYRSVMTRQGWTDIATELAGDRREIQESWPPKSGYMANDPGVLDRKLFRAGELSGFDKAVRAVCRALKKHSSRFRTDEFLKSIGVGKD